jgi:hypothetical protein
VCFNPSYTTRSFNLCDCCSACGIVPSPVINTNDFMPGGTMRFSFVETRALAAILETNIAGLDVAIEALENANYVATSARSRKKR